MSLPLIKGPNDFPFKHSGQPDQFGQSLGGDVGSVQGAFDARAIFNQEQINAIINALKSTTLNDDGAKQIGVNIASLLATNVNSAISEVYTAVLNLMLDPLVLPNRSVVNTKMVLNTLTEAEMANDMKKDIFGGITSFNKRLNDNRTQSQGGMY